MDSLVTLTGTFHTKKPTFFSAFILINKTLIPTAPDYIRSY